MAGRLLEGWHAATTFGVAAGNRRTVPAGPGLGVIGCGLIRLVAIGAMRFEPTAIALPMTLLAMTLPSLGRAWHLPDDSEDYSPARHPVRDAPTPLGGAPGPERAKARSDHIAAACAAPIAITLF